MLRSRGAAVLTCVLVACVIGGCSSGTEGGNGGADGGSGSAGSGAQRAAEAFGGLSVEEIALKATDEMLHLKSVHITGEVTELGERVGVDVSVDNQGNCVGTLSVRQGTAEIIATGDEQYVKGDKEFWTSLAGTQAERVMKVLDGRWAKVPASDGDSLGDVCSLEEFLRGLGRGEIDDADLSFGGSEEVGGVAAVEILSKEEDGTGHLWIGTEGPPYLLKLQVPASEEALVFTEFDEPVVPEIPAKGDVFDMPAAG